MVRWSLIRHVLGERGNVEVSGVNGVDVTDGANMVLGGCIDGKDYRPAHPPSHLLPLPQSLINYILIIVVDIGGLMDGHTDAYDS